MAPRRPVPPGRSGRPTTGVRAAPVRRPAQPRRPAARPAGSIQRAGDARPPRAPRPRAGAPAKQPKRLPVVRPVTMMSGVLVILALLIAPYVRPWLAQRSQLADSKEQLAGLQREGDALQAERNRWNDPDYIKAQARSRLHMVMPGEVGYVNLEPSHGTATTKDPRSAAAAVPPRSDEAWYGTLWQSVGSAGTPNPTAPPPSVPPSPAGAATTP